MSSKDGARRLSLQEIPWVDDEGNEGFFNNRRERSTETSSLGDYLEEYDGIITAEIFRALSITALIKLAMCSSGAMKAVGSHFAKIFQREFSTDRLEDLDMEHLKMFLQCHQPRKLCINKWPTEKGIFLLEMLGNFGRKIRSMEFGLNGQEIFKYARLDVEEITFNAEFDHSMDDPIGLILRGCDYVKSVTINGGYLSRLATTKLDDLWNLVELNLTNVNIEYSACGELISVVNGNELTKLKLIYTEGSWTASAEAVVEAWVNSETSISIRTAEITIFSDIDISGLMRKALGELTIHVPHCFQWRSARRLIDALERSDIAVIKWVEFRNTWTREFTEWNELRFQRWENMFNHCVKITRIPLDVEIRRELMLNVWQQD